MLLERREAPVGFTTVLEHLVVVVCGSEGCKRSAARKVGGLASWHKRKWTLIVRG